MPSKNKKQGSGDGPRQRKPSQEQSAKRVESQQSSDENDSKKDKRKIIAKPYIGNIEDPGVDEFVKDNLYLKTGYRIGFHSYKKAASSIFMLHNESMNIWSHLLGALGFLSLVFYVLIYLQPTSLHEATPLQSRWMQNFDNGRFDLLQCDKADFNFPTKGSEGE
mmetsp:Transcript_31415/g.36861  ORF Transcript_31415/g.36861 Transcript_31415/m.36861 type:complete len:164 (-) Transcript_31415:1253-1744(-)